jgi:cellulose synthase/poly-beta-1,6-N-acetylglucosamine synthase-like glycosyltransferase
MWTSFGLIAWTYVGYPMAAAAVGRLRRYAARASDSYTPGVALVIAAHNEESGLAERLENALEMDYPEAVEIVVASDGSTDSTVEVARRFEERGVRVLDLPRMGKVAAQDAAVATTTAEVLAFSDANARWDRDALRLLVRDLADLEVGYVCGVVRVDGGGGNALEGLYWRFELWLRRQESACGSITAGNGAIYVVRHSEYQALGSRRSHDLGLPFRLRRRGLRSLFDHEAVAHEPALPDLRDEWPRKVRMLSRAWWEILSGEMVDPRGQPPGYFAALFSHRVLRYASGPLHLVLLGVALARFTRDPAARALVLLQAGALGLALAGRHASSRVPLAGATRYYVVVNAASVAGLMRTLSRGPDAVWAPQRGPS